LLSARGLSATAIFKSGKEKKVKWLMELERISAKEVNPHYEFYQMPPRVLEVDVKFINKAGNVTESGRNFINLETKGEK